MLEIDVVHKSRKAIANFLKSEGNIYMRRQNIFIRLPIIFILFFIVGCGGSKEIDIRDYFNQLVESFKIATDEFFQKDYKVAKNLLLKYNQLDTLFLNYESYAFLAECYNQLGIQDSGHIIYQNIIQKLSSDFKEKPKSGNIENLALEDINRWYSKYPNFPIELRKENGFVPFDSPPNPIGGISEIQKKIEYPYSAKEDRLEGNIYVLTLVDEFGKPIDFIVLKSLAKPYDDAAINAIKEINFTIPKRKGSPHKYWVSIPIIFKLR